MAIVIFLSYFILKKVLIYYHKLYLEPGKLKTKMTPTDKSFLKMNSKITTLNDPNLELFYTDSKWSITNNNYIYDTLIDRYYIIEPGYYYYINPKNRYKITIEGSSEINLFSKLK